MVKRQKLRMLKGRIKYSTKVWYPDPRCFNDSAVDVKRICLYRKASYKIEKKNIYYSQNLFQPKIPIAQSHASEASGSVQLEFQKILLEKPAISLPLVNSMYEMDISCYLVLLLTLIYILYQLHYQQILQRIIDSQYNSVKCILNLIIGFCRFYKFSHIYYTT